MFSLLFLGFLIGMRHALEADHLAAVASLTTNSRSLAEAVRHGAAWGLGHTLTLFAFGASMLWLDQLVSQQLAGWLERAVGVMLILLGADVIRRVIQQRIHYHRHQHGQKSPHFHAHSHAGEAPETHHHDQHKHTHPKPCKHQHLFPLRTLCVGLMHGMAGSAALAILALDSTDNVLTGLSYILLFGIGSILGMALLSVVIATPLRYAAKGLTWSHNGLQLAIGLLTIGLGTTIIFPIA